jgi:predicted esterase
MATEFIHKFVPGRLPVTVLLLHGSGGDENDLLAVARAIAPGAAFLSPRGKVTDRGMLRFYAFDKSDLKERTAELAEWIAEAAAKYEIDAAREALQGRVCCGRGRRLSPRCCRRWVAHRC